MFKLVRNFFDYNESWGRQNRNQFLIGFICSIIYILINLVVNKLNAEWNPFLYSSNGLLFAAFICTVVFFAKIVTSIFNLHSSKFPWYEKYLPTIITLLGLITLMALQNLHGRGSFDAALWVDIVFLLTFFMIAAGYFVDGKNNEKTLKIWFSLLGYYFSVIGFFYFLEEITHKYL
jgi:hypothetical protein